MLNDLSLLLRAAMASRMALASQLAAESTNAYRLFHGTAEGQPGLTIDRYGPVLLVQTFHHPLPATDLAAIQAFYASVVPHETIVYNDRSQPNSRVRNRLPGDDLQQAKDTHTFSELGIRYHFAARHHGQDPWLFLDMRAGRRRILAQAHAKSVLNVFAYTCGVGLVAAASGAARVLNIDFAESSLAVGRDNAALNGLSHAMKFIKIDAFAALRQLAGLGQPQVVRGRRMPAFPKLASEQFDLVFLDPPAHAKSPFGVVDLIRDYPALFKLALLATAPGGTLICANNVAAVSREDWLSQLQRCANKAGRVIRDVEWIPPEADFPSPDGRSPLKLVQLRV